jgi:transglutaminase elicitor
MKPTATLSFLLCLVSPCWGQASIAEIDTYNRPERLGGFYERSFAALPTRGSASRVPWTGTYWPKFKGGITHRWQTDEAHTYLLHSLDRLRTMSRLEVARLSPSEKYDIYVGNYDYPLTTREKARNHPHTPSWQGYCHGWAPASINYSEPAPITVTNSDGIVIDFGASDVKALLSLFQGEVIQAERYTDSQLPYRKPVLTVGSLTRRNDPLLSEVADTNPGAFHLVLANKLGKRGESFVIDATTTSEIWNHPVHAFESQVLARGTPRPGGCRGAALELLVSSTVTYTTEIAPRWTSVSGTSHHSDVVKVYTYLLDLDTRGRILGGRWVTKRPDGSYWTLRETYQHFRSLDANRDGVPDLSLAAARAEVWDLFDYPDCLWTQARGEFSRRFRQAASSMSFLANSQSTRRELYAYLAKLADLLPRQP